MRVEIRPSERMDTNKKENRDESSLARMSAAVRDSIGCVDGDLIELWSGSEADDRLKTSTVLSAFQAYTSDLSALENSTDPVVFVTTSNHKRLSQNGNECSLTVGIPDCILGCDPEFLLFDESDNVIHANTLLSKAGMIGSDAVMAEVRPAPATTPKGIVSNIRAALSSPVVEKIKHLDWRATCYHKNASRSYYVGGHIHVDTPAIIGRKLPTEEHRRPLFSVMNKILDELVAIPMTKLDGQDGALRRNARDLMGPFGYFGGWRFCYGRLEHRTLSGVWLSDPKITEAVFGVTRCVVSSMFAEIESSKYSKDMLSPPFSMTDMYKETFDSWKEIPLAKAMKCTASSGRVKTVLHESLPSRINRSYLLKWKGIMKSLPTYHNDSEQYVDALYDLLSTPVDDIRKREKSIRRNWL